MKHLSKRLRLALIATGALTAGLIVTLPAVAYAQTASCDTTTLPLGGGPSTQATCQVAGFAPSERLELSSSSPRFEDFSSEFQADAAGASFFTFFSKDCLTPLGPLTVTVTGQTSGRTLNQNFTVDPSEFCPTDGPTEDMPPTGSTSAPLVGGAAAALVAGGLALLVSRRRTA